jgi:hypothetical protein
MKLAHENKAFKGSSVQLIESSYQFQEPVKRREAKNQWNALKEDIVKTKLRSNPKNPLLTFVKKEIQSQPKTLQRHYSIPNLYVSGMDNKLNLKSRADNIDKIEHNKTRNKLYTKQSDSKNKKNSQNKIIFQDFNNFDNLGLYQEPKRVVHNHTKSFTSIPNGQFKSNANIKKVKTDINKSKPNHQMNTNLYSTNITKKKFVTNPTNKTHAKSYSIHENFFTSKNNMFNFQKNSPAGTN